METSIEVKKNLDGNSKAKGSGFVDYSLSVHFSSTYQ